MSEEKKRKEAIKGLKRLRDDFSGYKPNEEMFDMAIAALSAEPCEDAISRQAVLDAFGLSEKTRKNGGDQSGYDTMMLYEIQQTLEDLPPVTPKQRTGHNCNKDYADCDQFVCSECGIELQDWHRIERDEDDGEISCHEYVMKYCPQCGAKMVEPQESKDKCKNCEYSLNPDYTRCHECKAESEE